MSIRGDIVITPRTTSKIFLTTNIEFMTNVMSETKGTLKSTDTVFLLETFVLSTKCDRSLNIKKSIWLYGL